MANWTGFQPQRPSGATLSEWVRLTTEFPSPGGGEARWWEGPNCGLTFTPANCSGISIHEYSCGCNFGCTDCGECPADPPTHELPPTVTFEPFWIDKCYSNCELRDLDEPIDQRLEAELRAAGMWHGLARELWNRLATQVDDEGDPVAVALGSDAVRAEQALSVLNHARADVGSGVILAPGYLMGAFKGIAQRNSSNQLTAFSMPLIIDPGFSGEGPIGEDPVAAPLEGWVYHIDQLPVAGVRTPVPTRIDHNNNGCHAQCCVMERRRQQAIVAFNACRVYAVKVKVDCD